MSLSEDDVQKVKQIVKDEMNARRLAQKKFRQADRRAQQRVQETPGNNPTGESK